MTAGKVSGSPGIAPHDGDQLGSVGLLEGGAALVLGDVAAPHDAPADGALSRRWHASGSTRR